jgi:glutathione S-transferase
MLQLHYFPGNASLIPHIVLEELGLEFELLYVDRAVAAHKSDAYLALNPNGLIPVLVDDAADDAAKPLVLYETAAICLYLADTHQAAGLMPPLGTAERAHAYKWLAWLTNTLQTSLIVYFYPERWADDAAAIQQVKAHAETKIDGLLDQLAAEFTRHGGPWLLGEPFSLLDPYAFVLCRWTRGFGRPARERAALKPWLDRMLVRPAVQQAMAAEKLKGAVV